MKLYRLMYAVVMVVATMLVTITANAQGGGAAGRAGGDTAAGRGGRGGGRGRGGPPVPATGVALPSTTNLVELEMMTWPEVKRAIHELGKTTAIVYNGGTETRGPQNVNGGHTLMARATAKAIAEKLGNAIAAPVLAYSTNNASADLPGTIGLSAAVFKQMNTEIAEQLIKQGFKNVMLMGDHGGGQAQLGEVANELDAKYSPEGIHVYFISDAYAKAQADFEKWLADHGYPCAGHAGIPDTSEMMYLGLDKAWVRKELIATAVGNYTQCKDMPVDSVAAARPRVNNGISGDARRSTVELGKMAFDYKVDYAVKQIKEFLAAAK